MSEQNAAAPSDLQAIWNRTTDAVKERVLMPALWRAMEHGRAITLEDGLFVVGYRVEEAYDSHLLLDTRYRNVIEQALAQAAGQECTLRVIHGTTMEEWIQLRDQEREAERLRAAMGRRETPAPVAGEAAGWDGLSEQLVRRFANTPWRQLPAVQAEFLDTAVEEIARAYPRLMSDQAATREADMRTYSRLLDRLADRTGVPAAVIGYLVVKRRQGAGGEKQGA